MDNQSNIPTTKISSRSQILRYIIHHQRVSKTAIAEALGVSVPTVLHHTKEFAEAGLITDVGEFKSTGGRKARVIAPINDAKYAIGIDITKNHIGFALTDLSGEVIAHTRNPQPFFCSDEYISTLWSQAEKFLAQANKPKENFLGYGISLPGIINSETQTVEFSHALGLSNVSCHVFSKHTTAACIFINDANAALCAEMYDVSKRCTTAYLSLSNTVGGSFYTEHGLTGKGQVIDAIYPGENFRSYEFGHMTFIPGGRDCYCGKMGCVDAYCSAKVLSAHTDGNLEAFFMALESGSPLIKSLWLEYVNNVAVVINNLRTAFDCQVIVGGYVGSFIEPHLPLLCEKAASLNTFEANTSYIKNCTYRIEASALGAALRHIEVFIYTLDRVLK